MKSRIYAKVVLHDCNEPFSFTCTGYFVANLSSRSFMPSRLRIWICPYSYDDYAGILFSSIPLSHFLCAFIHGFDSCTPVPSSDINGSFVDLSVDYDSSLLVVKYLHYEFSFPFTSVDDVLRHPSCLFDFLCSCEDDGQGGE